MSPTLQLWFTVLGAVIGILALLMSLAMILGRRHWTVQRLLQARLVGLARTNAARAVAVLRRSTTPHGVLNRLLEGRLFTTVVSQALQRSGLTWTTARFTWLVVLGIATGLVATVWLPPVAAVLVGILGGLLPFLIVAVAHHRRIRRIEEQLPDAVEMLVNALKAGYSLQASMSFVGSEMPAPLGPEFNRFYDEQRLGMDIRQALENLHTRLGTLDGRMLVLALLMQRETGGNLSEILENIARLVRERIEFRGQVDVLTSESKLSATVLTLLPVAMFFIIQLVSPQYTAVLTGSEGGRFLLLYALISLVLGAILMRRMAHIEA